ncbi:hypothetical protein LSTR_LSTR007239 [Laodelphax striatellus]|uniref:Uncharacterized protein n=1 Tax=Laodelphax striatellus TaxID=195883 RepID=A0A482XDV2_LAOST|nr:hypothetical protein LSTR_LSTR007239 [Laodelphax striatellus]
MECRHCLQMMFLAFLLVCGSVVRCDDSVEGGDETADASLYAKREAMWFGPRLGRNKRTQYDITMTTGGVADNNLLTYDTILDLLRDSNWALIPVTSADSSDKVLEPSWLSRLGRTEDDEEAMEASRSPPFAPRLGRRRHLVSVPRFAPRLGRTGSQPPSAHH